MRAREAAHEEVIGDGTYIVVRLDGRGFTALSRELELKKPFDIRFRDHMVATARHLMGCGFRTTYGYTQSDEISLVLDRDHDAFGRRLQKTVSVLAGEASAALSLALEGVDEVVDYLHWRRANARRNARVAAAVNVVLYDRIAKRWASVRDAFPPTDGLLRCVRGGYEARLDADDD